MPRPCQGDLSIGHFPPRFSARAAGKSVRGLHRTPMRSPAVTEIAVSVPDVTDFVCRSVAAADEVAEPFFHLEFSRVFPDEIYARMLAAMPTAADYRPMSGRSKSAQAGGRPTRVKTDLLPEYIRHLPMEKQPIWSVVGRALCSPELKAVFRRKLAPGLRRRFGDRFDRT